jgi:hypothetical protein
VTTSWSIPNSPPDGPQVQQLAGRLSFEAATGEPNMGPELFSSPCPMPLPSDRPLFGCPRPPNACSERPLLVRRNRLAVPTFEVFLRGGVKTQVSSLFAIDSIPSAPTRCASLFSSCSVNPPRQILQKLASCLAYTRSRRSDRPSACRPLGLPVTAALPRRSERR